MSSKVLGIFSLYLLIINVLFSLWLSGFLHVDAEGSKRNLNADPGATPSRRKPIRRAVAMFVDSPTYMYGVYSVKTQMARFQMTSQGVEQVVVIPDDFSLLYPNEWSVLNDWMGGDHHIQQVRKAFLHDKLDSNLWKGTFNKLWLFNLTAYDKVIVLDSDILIRTSLLHWFEYTTPSATQSPEDPITWNSGAMVIEPNATLFDQMIEILPRVRSSSKNEKNAMEDADTDPWTTSSNTDQDFLSAFFTQANLPHQMKTLPSYASVISSKLKQGKYQHWTQFRRRLIETVHFTSIKPWKPFATSEPLLCHFLREWKESVRGMDSFAPRLRPIPHDYLRSCPTME